MDEKFQEHLGTYRDHQARHHRRRARSPLQNLGATLRDRSVRRLIFLLCLVTTVWIFLHRTLIPDRRESLPSDVQAEPASSKSQTESHPHGVFANFTKVPLEAHIMSKCPDAKRCLRQLVVPAMEQISEKVDFQLSYIGTLDPASDAVECKHGPSECLGNIILLCAEHLYPSPILHLGFANCLIDSYKQIPDREFVEECALEHGLDFGKINECISDDGGEGIGLLRDSITRSQDAGVLKSCTVRVDEKEWCLVDGGKWIGCEEGEPGVKSLVEEVEKKWEKLNHIEA